MVLLISGCITRLFERILWKYTFDFIAIKSIGILDLVDVCFLVGGIGFVITGLIFSKYEKEFTNGMTKEEIKIMSKKQNKEFIKLLLNKF